MPTARATILAIETSLNAMRARFAFSSQVIRMAPLRSAGHHGFEAALAPVSEEEIDEALRTLVALSDVLHADITDRNRRDPDGRADALTHSPRLPGDARGGGIELPSQRAPS